MNVFPDEAEVCDNNMPLYRYLRQLVLSRPFVGLRDVRFNLGLTLPCSKPGTLTNLGVSKAGSSRVRSLLIASLCPGSCIFFCQTTVVLISIGE